MMYGGAPVEYPALPAKYENPLKYEIQTTTTVKYETPTTNYEVPKYEKNEEEYPIMKMEYADALAPANRYRRSADRKYPAVKAATKKMPSPAAMAKLSAKNVKFPRNAVIDLPSLWFNPFMLIRHGFGFGFGLGSGFGRPSFGFGFGSSAGSRRPAAVIDDEADDMMMNDGQFLDMDSA
jgi:hypothetical protein